MRFTRPALRRRKKWLGVELNGPPIVIGGALIALGSGSFLMWYNQMFGTWEKLYTLVTILQSSTHAASCAIKRPSAYT